MHDDDLRADPGPLLEGISTIFASIGRGLVCLDREFRVVHASPSLDALVAPGAAAALLGRSVEEVLGAELFGPDGPIRKALAKGERREGWGSSLKIDSMPSLPVSLTAAPIIHDASTACDPRVAYVVVVRPSQLSSSGRTGTTVFAGMVARSAPMLQIFRLIRHLEESEATVLIGGASGTGKEMVARAVHQHSSRSHGPLVPVNCGALPGDLLESELFGHVRGSFTGAVRDRVGRFELAHGGTLFLDEVGELPLHLQVKLLRVLQEGTFERLGESHSRTSDARVIAASNRELRQLVHDGKFRADLYFRLRVVPIDVPRLRERREDIEPLAHHLLARTAARQGRDVRLAPDAQRCLLRYDWPGNVRELGNALEYAVAVCRSQTIHAGDLPLEVSEPAIDRRPGEGAAPPLAADTRDGSEAQRIREALEASHWRRAEAAAALGISRTTLWRQMRELGIAPR